MLADKTMIEQVIINLIKNAIQAFDEQPENKLNLTAIQTKRSHDYFCKDNGSGIDSEAWKKSLFPSTLLKKPALVLG